MEENNIQEGVNTLLTEIDHVPVPDSELPVETTPVVVEPPIVPVTPIEPASVEPVVVPVVEPVVVETPAVPVTPTVPDAPVVIAPPPAIEDPKDAQIKTLMATVEQLRGMVEQVAKQTSTQPTHTPASQKLDAAGNPIVEPPTVMKFVEKEEELDKILNSVDNFNTFMTNVVVESNKQILAAMPAVVQQMASGVVTQKMAVAEFYNNNKDLIGNKAFVGMVADELARNNPTWTIQNIVEKLGAEVRTRLSIGSSQPGIVSTPQALQSQPTETPAFVPGGGARPNGGITPTSRMEKGIADLISGID